MRRFMTGSIRESAMDIPPLLRGGFPPLMKALTAAFRRCSSSNSAFLFFRRKKKAPAAIAPATTTPATTPVAIPVTFVFDEDPSFEGVSDDAGAVCWLVAKTHQRCVHAAR